MNAKTITACRSCGSEDLRHVFDLGNQRLSEFRADSSEPPRFPLQLCVCQSCTLAQLRHTVPPELLYHDSYSFKSGISDAIRHDLADVAAYALANNLDATRWLDIASNDGTLLSNVPNEIYRAGIDPLAQFADEARTQADRIVTDMFDASYFTEGEFDVITSVSMFYDLDDPNAFVAGVEKVLAPNGIWVIQQNYLSTMLENGSLDNMSHEHLAYYSLHSLIPLLRRHGLAVVDVQLDPINGGCFRTLVRRENDTYPWRGAVGDMFTQETNAGIDGLAQFEKFASRAADTLGDIKSLVDRIRQGGERVYVYGASTRGAVIWQAAGLDVNDLPFVVDRNPDKLGRYMSSIGAPIISEEEMRADPPEYLLVGPYWLRDDFVKREAEYLERGGKFIFPLPKLEVVSK